MSRTKPFTIQRTKEGIPRIKAPTLPAAYEGLGYMHGRDRSLQMLFMRLLGQGRISEFLVSSKASLGVDLFFRRMNWTFGTAEDVRNAEGRHKEILEAYCYGINRALEERFPWELKIMGLPFEPWTPEDTLLVTRMTGYLTLSQSQGEMEQLFVEMVKSGVDKERLEALFPGILEEADLDLIGQVEIPGPIVSPPDLWEMGAPRMMASNSWAVTGKKTRSGRAILANDPHLEINRLPAIWYEAVMECTDGEDTGYAMGAGMPGIPGILIGRTEHISWGATYTFMDAQDSWIERCSDGRYYREDSGWQPFRIRREEIKRKKKPAHIELFYENAHGVLAGDPADEKERYLLTSCWAAQDTGMKTLESLLGLWNSKTVEDGMETMGRVGISFNWIFADTSGNIGYQMSGKMPLRRKGIKGFVPLPGWRTENDWQGYVSPEDLPRCLNPEEGYIVTANQDLNHLGKQPAINMPMGDYRARRIEALLKEKTSLDFTQMKEIQNDLYSREAEDFLNILLPLIEEEDSRPAALLKNWDRRYTLDSQAPALFEGFLKALYARVFGKSGFGEGANAFLRDETGIYIDFYGNFNGVLLSEESPWFGSAPREELYREAWKEASAANYRVWGDLRRYTQSHILFGGSLPAWLGFDKGPYPMPGSRATVCQGQIYESAGRITTFAPSCRIMADMGEKDLSINLAGGVSDRRFSKYYCNRMKDFLNNKSTVLSPTPALTRHEDDEE